MIGVGSEPHPNAPTIPSNLFFIYQGMFAAITPCLAFGSAAERTTVIPFETHYIWQIFFQLNIFFIWIRLNG